MNQSILFNDDLIWVPTKQHVYMTAQCSGAIVQCYISLEYLKRLGLKSLQPEAIIEFCELCQFDIEEDAQHEIAEERLNEDNQLYLK